MSVLVTAGKTKSLEEAAGLREIEIREEPSLQNTTIVFTRHLAPARPWL
jgi:hypothetical protein